MESCKDKMLVHIKEASLSADDSKLWEMMLEELPENMCQLMLGYVEADSSGIAVLNDDMKAKYAALQSGDMESWTALMEKEKALQDLL